MSNNIFARLRAAGYPNLVPIIPPDAPISERSTLFKRVGTHQDGRGKTPGIKSRDGNWFGFDWVPYQSEPQNDERWHAMGAGTGIKTGDGLLAFDADTLDPALAEIIRAEIEKLGVAPIRVGQAPKALYLFRCDEAVPYQRIEFGARNARGTPERLEILTAGRQFVAHGIHPRTRAPFTWPRPLTPYDKLPAVSGAQVSAVLERLRTLLPESSALIREGGAAGAEVDQNALRGRAEIVAKAVAAIPNNSALFPSREAYRDMGYAIRAAVEDERSAFDIWAEWCGRWEDGANDPDIMEADWRRMKPPYRRGASWLYELAETHSAGRFSRASAFFEELPDAPVSVFAEQEARTASEAKAADVYRLWNVAEIMNQPEPRWLIARHIPAVSMGFLYSEPGAGKSFLALDMALSIAAGDEAWQGDTIESGGRSDVLYLASEGAWGFRNRIRAWLKTRGESKKLDNFKMLSETINFMKVDDVGKLLRTIRGAGMSPALIVVDTVSRALPGADENLQKDMTLFVRACDAARDAFGCAVLGVHHAGKSGDMRGSTVLLGAGDFVFRLKRKPGARIAQLGCEKQKDGPDGWSDNYAFSSVAFGLPLGGSASSLVADRIGGTVSAGAGEGSSDAPGAGPATGGADLTKLVLEAMRAAWEAGEPWHKAPQTRERYAVRRIVADMGVKAAEAETIVTTLEGMGVIQHALWGGRGKVWGYRVEAFGGQDVQETDMFD